MIVEITAATEEANGDLNLTYSVDGFQGNGMTITADTAIQSNVDNVTGVLVDAMAGA